MREETGEFATHAMVSRLEVAGALPLQVAILHMQIVRRFIENCIACGCEDDLRIAMERAGLGALADAVLNLE
jgi:hypothetical protein